MTPTRLKDLAAAAATKRFRSEAAVDRWLDEQHVYGAEQRIAVKLQLDAAGALQTDQPLTIGELATDRRHHTPEAPVSREMAAWLRKAGLSGDRTYTDAEVTQAFRASDLGIEERLAVRHHLSSLGRLRAAGARPSVQAGRDLSASAAPRPRGNVLRNPDGSLRTLRGSAW